jgi:hypothetical protein
MAAPVLNLVFLNVRQAIRNKLDTKSRNWLITIAAIVGSYSIAVVRHSWRENYNSELPTKIMGRYFLFITPIIFILAFIGLNKFDKEKGRSLWRYALTTVILPFGLVLFSYFCDIKRLVFPMAETVIKKWGSIDGYLIVLMEWRFLFIIAAIFLAVSILLWKNKKELAVSVLFIAMVIYSVVELPSYYQDVQQFTAVNLAGKKAAEQIIADHPNDYSTREIQVYIPDIFESNEGQRIYMSIRIRGIHNLGFSSYTDLETMDFQNGDYVLIEDSSTGDFSLEEYPFIETP